MTDSRMRGDGTAAEVVDGLRSKPGASEVRAALERILASRCFQQAGRASDFLRFVVEQTLAGGGQRLKGYTIGVEVFGRPADFDAQSDALVRVEAGRLRRRLVEYYAGDGVADAVRIELPRGTYAVEYRFASPGENVVPAEAPPALPKAAQFAFPWRSLAFALGVLLVGAAVIISWQGAELRKAESTLTQLDEPLRTEWPRIVVVPFENLTSDVALDALAASMTEEIMLRLDELDLFVIASQASWYAPSEQTSLDTQAAGGYVLTGSVRGSEDQARITARLIEAETGAQLWTAAYDEPAALDRLPALQQRVAQNVAAIAAPYGPIFESELARARRSMHAPKLRDCLAAYHEYRRVVTRAGYQETLECLQNVSARQPEIAPVWSGLAMLYVDEYSSSFGRTGSQALDAAREATAKALAIDGDDFLANMALTRVQFFAGDASFRDSIERAIALRPDSSQARAQGGFLLVVRGDAEEGIPLAEEARELTKGPLGFYHLTHAMNHLREQRFSDALASAASVDGENWVFAQAVLAAAAAHSGRYDVARDAAERIRQLYPEFEAEALGTFERWSFDAQIHEALVTGLRAAGLDLTASKARVAGG
jgi:adenylate cyclase